MAKPTADTKWAAAATKTQPSSGQKDAGWVVGQKPPAQWLNWWMDAVDQWVKWLEDYEDTAHTWTALQTLQSGLSVVDNAAALSDAAIEATGGFNKAGVMGTSGASTGAVGLKGVGVNGGALGKNGVLGLGGTGTTAAGYGLGGQGGAGAGANGFGGIGVGGTGGSLDGTTNSGGSAGPGGSFSGGSITSDANNRKGGPAVQLAAGSGQDGYGPAIDSNHGDWELDDGDIRQTTHGSSGVNQLLSTYFGEDIEVNGAGLFNAALSVVGLLTASGGIALEAPIAIAPLLVGAYTEFTTSTYWKNPMGEVGMRGMLAKNAAAQGSTAFTLPVGYRPAVAQRFVCSSDPDLGFAYIYVQTSGAVLIQWDTAFTGYIVLDAVRFRTT